ncbi:MAG: hypothetical protein Fur0041_01090 [Bacteroidia bacterium]
MKANFKLSFSAMLLLLITGRALAQGQGTGDMKVTVLDENKKPFPGVVVRIIAGGPMTGGQTDLDGHYTFRSLSPGVYDVEARMVNYKVYVKQKIQVTANQTAYADFPMQLKEVDKDSIVVITALKGPVDPTYTTFTSINADQVKHMPVSRGDVLGMITGTNSSTYQDRNGGLVMRGARSDASQMFIDGEKLYGSMGIPGLAIEQVTVLSGGIPAEFGDLTGGAVIITTKSYYNGMAYRQTIYEEAAKKAEEAKKAQMEKEGKLKETDDKIIEQQDQVPPVEQPK